jgi:hypothetical protein
MEINKDKLESILSDFKKGFIDSGKVWDLLKKNIDLDEDLAICQLHCAGQFYWGAGIDLDTFIRENDLNHKKYLKLAKEENIFPRVICEIKNQIQNGNKE